tara:strand:- start:933 stop:1508 length:576 start_codon:yes stop_codon:yes gene_type:complete
MATTLKPLHDYDPHDVINLFSWSGAVPATKGLMVKIATATGFQAGAEDPVEMFGAAGNAYGNTVSQRYRTQAQIVACGTGSAGVKDIPLGMLLYDVREEDENGEKLLFHPRKAAENDWVISGQACPVLTRGIVLYSGATLKADAVTPGLAVYAAGDGELSTSAAHVTKSTKVGMALGGNSSDGLIMLKLEL